MNGRARAPWTPDIQPSDEAENRWLQSAIYQALGSASMCWQPRPTGELDAEAVEYIGEGLIAFLQRRVFTGRGVTR